MRGKNMKRNYKLMLVGIALILFGFCETIIWVAMTQSIDWYDKHGTLIEKIMVLYMPVTEIIVALAPITGMVIVIIGLFIKNKDEDNR